MIEAHDRLARAARRLGLAAAVGIAVVAAGVAVGIWALLTGARMEGALTVSVDPDGLAPAPAAVVLGIEGALLIAALVQIVAMPRAVVAGAPFRTGARLRLFALYLFLSTLASALLPPLIEWGMTAAGLAQRVSFSLSSEELLMLFVTGLLFFVARLLEAAQRVDDEHRQIV